MSGIPPHDPQRLQHDDVTRMSGSDHVDDGEFIINESPNQGPTTGPIGLLGEYLLLDRIGAGGMGEVFRAEHRTMNRQVAVKILSRKIADNPQLLERFFHEIRAVAKSDLCGNDAPGARRKPAAPEQKTCRFVPAALARTR